MGRRSFLPSTAEAARKGLSVGPFYHMVKQFFDGHSSSSPEINGGILVKKGETIYFASIFYIISHGIFQ